MQSLTFNVSVNFENLVLTDDNIDRIFDVLPDAVPATTGDPVTITSPIDAVDAEDAALGLVEIIRRALPEAIAVRVDQDLVSIPDIADRTGRTRESIRLLVEGDRGPGNFPAPVGTVGGAIRIWPWAVILEWFANDLDEEPRRAGRSTGRRGESRCHPRQPDAASSDGRIRIVAT